MALGDWIHLVMGGLALAVFCGIATAGLLRRAKRASLLRPVAGGLGLRFGVMVVAHGLSVATGHHGFFYVDDGGYSHFGVLISRAWLHGHLVDPSGYAYSGSYASAYPTLVALIYLVLGPQVLAVKLVDVLMGGAVVFLTGRLTQQLFDPTTGRRVAWLTAVLPTLVWWAAPMLKEDLSILGVTAVVWAIVDLPRARAGCVLLVALVVLGLTRPAFAISFGAAATLAAAVAMHRAGQRQVGRRVFVSVAVVALVAVIVVSRGQPVAFVNEFRGTYDAMRELYQSQDTASVPVNLLRTLIAPYPWVFTRSAFSWYMPLYPGVLMLIILYPTAAAGVWRLRRRPELLSLLVLGSLLSLGLTVSAAGLAIRERASIEPVVLVLAAAGWRSTRRTLQFGAGALAAAAAFAGLQSRSPLPSAGLLLMAAGLWLIARRAPGNEVTWGAVAPLHIGLDLEPVFNLGPSLRQACHRAFVLAPTPSLATRPARLGRLRLPSAQMRTLAGWLLGRHGLVAAARSSAPMLTTVVPPPAPQVESPRITKLLDLRPGLPALDSTRLPIAPRASVAPVDAAPPPSGFRARKGKLASLGQLGSRLRGRRDIEEAARRQGALATPSSAPSGKASGKALTQGSSGGYRPALDGIRAVAVIGVIAYHLGSGVPGGFLGVDAFFVLSGYLITTLLLQGFAALGVRSLSRFWMRRARRLLPALLILIAVCALVTSLTAPVSTLHARRADMISAVFYYANWHLIATDQSYFAMFAGTSPLRHVWSLAIEEQFYLVWPLLLFLLAVLTRARTRLLLVTVLIGAGASAIDLILRFDPTNPSGTYYATDTRAQQLLVGAALAVVLSSKVDAIPAFARSLLARAWPISVAALVWLVVVLRPDHGWYFRGGASLFAVAVALLLASIELQPESFVARFLSLPPVRWIGLISYGLYLWHWPMIVWISDPSVKVPDKPLLAVVATLVVATLSFYLIERPIRRGRLPRPSLTGARFAVATACCLLFAGGMAVYATITPATFAAAVGKPSDSPCPLGSPSVGIFRWCVRTPGRGPHAPVIAVIGDSTSRALDPGMQEVALSHGWRYLQGGQGGCSALDLSFPPSDTPAGLAQASRCVGGVPQMIRQVLKQASPRVWIYTDRWPETSLRLPGGALLGPVDRRREAPVKDALRALFAELTSRGAEVLVVGTPPTGAPADCAFDSSGSGCKDYARDDPVTLEVNKLYHAVAAEFPGRVFYVSITDILCPTRAVCPAEIHGTLARYDQIHYTYAFSRQLVPQIIARADALGVRFASAHATRRDAR